MKGQSHEDQHFAYILLGLEKERDEGLLKVFVVKLQSEGRSAEFELLINFTV